MALNVIVHGLASTSASLYSTHYRLRIGRLWSCVGHSDVRGQSMQASGAGIITEVQEPLEGQHQ